MPMDLQSTALVPHWARRDPLKNEPWVKVRLKTRVNYTFGGMFLKYRNRDAEGWLYAEGYESDFQRAMADVEDQESLLETARKTHVRKLRAYVCKTASVTDDLLPQDESLWKDDQIRARNMYTGSPEAVFRDMLQRDLKPLIAIEKLETLPPPQTEEQQQIARAVEAAVAAQVKGKK